MDRVPILYQTLGLSVVVKYYEDASGREQVAHWDPSTNTIWLDPSRSDELQLADFLHESVHNWLEACGREDLSENEGFVNMLSGLIHQMLVTVEYGE